MKKKVFLFDMDGVLIDSDRLWAERKPVVYERLFGREIAQKMGAGIGSNREENYKKARAFGATVTREEYDSAVSALAPDIYRDAPITKDIEQLGAYLLKNEYNVGIVSASERSWIEFMLERLPFADDVELVISLFERDDLAHKPSPDGYLAAMTALGVSPEETVILEDSNVGIEAAKASGAFTIGLRCNLLPGYEQKGADIYAKNPIEVVKILEEMAI